MLSVLGACRQKPAQTAKSTPPPPTAPPITAVVTPTATLPPNMQLDAKIDPSIARALTAAAPATPTFMGESPAERRQHVAPATPVPTVVDHP